MTETGAPQPTAGRRLLQLLLAVVVATVGAQLAPEPWPPGAALLSIEVDGRPTFELPVTVGAPDPIEGGTAAWSVALPDGIPTDAPMTVTLTAPDAVEPAFTLYLGDGRSEPIPVLRTEPDTNRVIAVRRPPNHAAPVLGLLGLVVVLWVSEAIPLFATSLLVPVVIVLTGSGSADDAFAPFFHPIIALFFGGFLMAEAMHRVGLDRVAAVTLVAAAGRSPAALAVGMMGVAAFLSMWMSNTAATAVLIPVALAVTAPIDHPGYRRLVVLGIAYAATLGGVGSAIGTPANPLAIEFLDTVAGREISFAGWFAYGLPMVVIFLPVVAAYLWWRMGATIDPAVFAEVRSAARREMHRVGRLNRDQGIVLGVFAAVMLAWLTQTFHGVNTGIVAVAGAVVLAALGKIVAGDLGRISWASLLTFGGGLTLGTYLTLSGMSDWLAARLAGLAGLPSPLAVGLVAIATLALTTVASNTATAAMMIPLAIPLSGMLGVSPVLMVMVVAVASSIDFALVVGTPPTLIAYSTGLFTAREIFRVGGVLDLLGVGLLVTAVVAVWRALGIV